jgi:hypothetical protein
MTYTAVMYLGWIENAEPEPVELDVWAPAEPEEPECEVTAPDNDTVPVAEGVSVLPWIPAPSAQTAESLVTEVPWNRLVAVNVLASILAIRVYIEPESKARSVERDDEPWVWEVVAKLVVPPNAKVLECPWSIVCEWLLTVWVCAGNSVDVRVTVFAPPEVLEVVFPLRKTSLFMFGITTPFIVEVPSEMVWPLHST